MKKFSNKTLIIILILLVSIFSLSRIFRSPKLEGNLIKELVSFDSAKVTEVRIQPTGGGSELKLLRVGNQWKVANDAQEAAAETGTVESMLGVVMHLPVQRMVTRKKEKWETYEVTDNSTRVTVFSGNDKQADFRIGKNGFAQGGGAFTYVRLNGENEVYATNGYFGSYFNKSFNDWRNKTFLQLNKEEVTKIEFVYPDSSYVLEKKDSAWYIGNSLADESKVTQYLNKIGYKTIAEFEDGFVPSASAALTLQIVGSAGVLATAQAWQKNDEDWVLSSSNQDGVYFVTKKSDVIKDLFVGSTAFSKN